MEARSSQDLACCWRATASARSKYACAFAVSGSGDLQRDFASDAIDLGLAPSFLGCFDRVHRFADAAPSVIELAECPHELSPNVTSTSAQTTLLPLTGTRRFRR